MNTPRGRAVKPPNFPMKKNVYFQKEKFQNNFIAFGEISDGHLAAIHRYFGKKNEFFLKISSVFSFGTNHFVEPFC
jgi:hypothetical protein